MTYREERKLFNKSCSWWRWECHTMASYLIIRWCNSTLFFYSDAYQLFVSQVLQLSRKLKIPSIVRNKIRGLAEVERNNTIWVTLEDKIGSLSVIRAGNNFATHIHEISFVKEEYDNWEEVSGGTPQLGKSANLAIQSGQEKCVCVCVWNLLGHRIQGFHSAR